MRRRRAVLTLSALTATVAAAALATTSLTTVSAEGGSGPTTLGAIAPVAKTTKLKDRKPTAAVSLGDSYIAGVGGRWAGNTTKTGPGYLGTDRAWKADPADPNGTTDISRVYGATGTTCLRSDVAPILSARLHVDKKINLACGGAVTKNVLRASAGGVGLSGEAPQNDQLAAVAQANDVKLIVLSIGGNDLGFANTVSTCVANYLFAIGPCNETLQPTIDAALPAVEAAIGATIDDIKATMAAAGYKDKSYKLVVQTYPQPQPAAAKSRYAGEDPQRLRATEGGCPFYDVDLDWARTKLGPGLAGAVIRAARSHGAQVLDLTDTVRGHELCSADAKTSGGSPRSSDSEWVRFIDSFGQGNIFESMHPNAYGQKAMGRCLELTALVRSDVACKATRGLPPSAVYLTPLPKAAKAG